MTCGKLVLLWIRKLIRFHSSVMCYVHCRNRSIRGDGLQTPVGIQFLCLTFSKIVNVDTVDYKFPCLGNLPLRLSMSHQPLRYRPFSIHAVGAPHGNLALEMRIV